MYNWMGQPQHQVDPHRSLYIEYTSSSFGHNHQALSSLFYCLVRTGLLEESSCKGSKTIGMKFACV